ncbi:MAG: hypothetical protein KGD74_11435 [Candidatus Lokiarchaeota archaeon]|nr:hypothetical protein [Candidatus Lokiarchaeota archaeon]
MILRKLNNADLWEKLQKLRVLIKIEKAFKQRTCWNCNKELNIYDFMSDNVNYSPEYILKLWQAPILEFHCCECFKYLKIHELKKIEKELSVRRCLNCDDTLDIYRFSNYHNYLKIDELGEVWLDKNYKIFCSNLCSRKYYKKKFERV